MRQAGPVRARIQLWGVRGTAPSPGAHTLRHGGNTSCVEVRTAGGSRILLDAGTGLRACGAAMDGGSSGIVHLVLSHRHGDHVFGLANFAPLIAGTHDVEITCGNAAGSELRPLVEALLGPPLFPALDGMLARLRFRDWSDADTVDIDSATRIRRHAARHPGAASVLVLADATGPTLAFAPDNELAWASTDPTVLAWRDALAKSLRGVPLLIHDAMYRDTELGTHVGWGHSSATEATRFAAACEAGSLLLFHHHPDRHDDEIDAMVEECGALARSLGSDVCVMAAAEGMLIEV